MCKHIKDAQVSIRAPCCKSWFDCTRCHDEASTHPLLKRFEIVFGCKKCKKVFRKDMRDWEEQDEFCPHCDNHFALESEETEETPQLVIAQSDDPELLRKQFGNVMQDDRMPN